MSGLNMEQIMHNLTIQIGCASIKQPPQKFSLETEGKIKKEVEKLLKVGFIKPIQHPTWLANIVLVMKKNSQI